MVRFGFCHGALLIHVKMSMRGEYASRLVRASLFILQFFVAFLRGERLANRLRSVLTDDMDSLLLTLATVSVNVTQRARSDADYSSSGSLCCVRLVT